jgi:hypothetical protein
MKVLCMCSVPVTAVSHSTDRPSLPLYCLLRLSNVVESGIIHNPLHSFSLEYFTVRDESTFEGRCENKAQKRKNEYETRRE